MEHILVQILSQMTNISSEEEEGIKESFPIRDYSKGAYLLKENAIAKDAYFVIKGCIREFMLLDGEEKTTAFYTENQSAINFNSMANNSPSIKNFVCTEETRVAVINQEKEQALYARFPRFETFCRQGMEQMMGGEQEKMARFMTMSPEERYKQILEERPELLSRVPQYQLASYLGVKPESLSRIRKRMSQPNTDEQS